ncbi:ribonuclease T2 family protein [Oryzifoliimicrobium ureilyticus]|uniref:ribonuclease T2 family protein n=1 Tax=Oryzifoliimicrobium ureilyticus TaxID=3113724 RepID=UPI00307682D3
MKKFVFSALILALAGVSGAGESSAQERHGKTSFILAASWQPAFCQGNQKKAECRSQTSDRPDTVNFSLHGLWPMRQQYCGVTSADQAADKKGDWSALPSVQLSDETKASLSKVMPGTQSGLERHEWTKHGSCTGISADQYFTTSARLIGELNKSEVQALFAANIGKTLTADQIKTAFDKSFGEGASNRVKMSCRKVGDRRLISELTIGLSAAATSGQESLRDLIQGAGRTSFGCDQGIVDPAGF